MQCIDSDMNSGSYVSSSGIKGFPKGFPKGITAPDKLSLYSACRLVMNIIFHINSKLLMQIVVPLEYRVVFGFHGNCSATENSCKCSY